MATKNLFHNFFYCLDTDFLLKLIFLVVLHTYEVKQLECPYIIIIQYYMLSFTNNFLELDWNYFRVWIHLFLPSYHEKDWFLHARNKLQIAMILIYVLMCYCLMYFWAQCIFVLIWSFNNLINVSRVNRYMLIYIFLDIAIWIPPCTHLPQLL